jgi:formate hydrogenlyase subunit 4
MSALAIARFHMVVHLAIVLLLPPLLLGVINKTKAVFAGRKGPPILQLYYELGKLFRKGTVFSSTTTWVFRAGPVVSVATGLLAALLVPLGAHASPASFAGDMILFAYLLGLSRFFTSMAALDTGSPFEGMGAAREVSFAVLAEPALFLGFVVIAKLSGSLSLSGMLAAPWSSTWTGAGAALVLVIASWLVVLLVENCRIPFDDPNTHLELTMIHEVMVLDHSGPLFGLVLYGASLKLFLLGALVMRLLFPFSTGNGVADWGLFAVSMVLLAVLIGAIESIMARLRLIRVPQLLVTACLLSGFGVVLLAR